MIFRPFSLPGLAAALIVLLAGCNKDEQPTTSPVPSGSTTSTTTSTTGTTSGNTTGSTSGTTSGSTTGNIPQYGFSLGSAQFPGAYVECTEWSGFYKLSAAVSNSPVTATVFLGGGKPTFGSTYTVVPHTGATQPGEASIVLNTGPAANDVYKSVSGLLTVTMYNGQVQTTYSEVQMKSLATGQQKTSSGSIGCF